MLADRWIAFYWPFVDTAAPILREPQAQLAGHRRVDLSFRPALAALHTAWTALVGASRPADGFILVGDLRIAWRRTTYPPALIEADEAANRATRRALEQPIKYAGPRGAHWAIFTKPAPRAALPPSGTYVPDSRPEDVCLVLTPALGDLPRCIIMGRGALHPRVVFVFGAGQGDGVIADRGVIYRLLTDRPDNRRPLDWERNQVDLLLEGYRFRCLWTAQAITRPGDYDLDHIIPLSAVPINELWNLVPADSRFNQHIKRDRLPTVERLTEAQDALALAYTHYSVSPALTRAFIHNGPNRYAS